MGNGNGGKIRLFQMRAIQALGGIVVLLVLGVIGWAIWSSMSSPAYTPVTVVVQDQPAAPRAAAGGTTQPTTQANARGGRGRRQMASPFGIFDQHHLTELAAWSKAWESDWSATSRPSSSEDLAQLKSLIDKSDLNASDQLTIGRYIVQKADKAVASVWFQSGINQTESEWTAYKQKNASDSEEDVATLVIKPLLPGLDAAGKLYWEPEYQNGEMEEKITRMEASLPRANQWDQRPEWNKIGHSEALMDEHRYQEALVEADELDKSAADPNSHFTDDQKTEMHWNTGMIFNSLKRYKEALNEFTIVIAGNSSFAHNRDAMMLRIMTLAELKQENEALNAAIEFIDKEQLDNVQAHNLIREVQDKLKGKDS